MNLLLGKRAVLIIAVVFFVGLSVAPRSAMSANGADISDDLKVFRSHFQSREFRQAYDELNEKLKKDLDGNARALTHFGLGLTAFEQNNFEKTIEHLKKSIDLGTRLPDYANYFVGEAYYKINDLKNAKRHLSKVLEHRPRSSRRYDARYILGEIAMEQKEWRTARNHFRYLERRERSSERYPRIILNLVRSEIKRRRKWVACRWARKLYRQFPADPVTADWSIDLHKAIVDDKELGCVASHGDQERRIRNLQHNGRSQQARKEIEYLLSRSSKNGRYHAESMLAEFLTNEGYVQDALKLLLPYYEDRKLDYNYLMSFGKAAGRAEEYSTAIGSYYSAYKVKARNRYGRRALYKSSYLSYQGKDYDGSLRKFEEFNKKYKRSRLSRDAKWYIGWLQYLKGNYKTAASYLERMTRGRSWKRRNPRTYRKAQYWQAMGFLKGGRLEEAKALFTKLADDGLVNYYALASLSRLNTLKGVTARKLAMDESDVVDSESENPVPVDDNETEDSVLNESPEEDDENIAAQDPTDISEEDETLVVTSFKDPRLADRFKRASDLEVLGFYEMAKWELYAIERRTRNQDYLRALMTHYQKIGAYNRAAHVGEIYFVSEREKKGIFKARTLWEKTYPEAYKKSVEKYAANYDIPKELIWAIMRAESHFKHTARSPVGALGLMQLMPYTGRRVAKLISFEGFHTPQLLDPDVNVRLGARYLKRLHDKFQGNIVLTAAAYNAGPHRVDRWLKSFGHLDMDEFIEHIPYLQTRNYAKKVSRNYYIYKALYGGDKEGKSIRFLATPLNLPAVKGPTPREDWSDIES